MKIPLDEIVGRDPDDLDDWIIWIDHRSEDDSIIEWVAEFVDEALSARWSEDYDRLWAVYDGAEYEIPISQRGFDRYITINSLSEILQDRYRFVLERERLGDDTHGLMVLPHGDYQTLESEHGNWFDRCFVPLDRGYDYFSGLRVPFTGQLDHNPKFDEQSARYLQGQAEMLQGIEQHLKQNPEFQQAMRDMRRELGTASRFKRWLRRYWALGLLLAYVVYKYWFKA